MAIERSPPSCVLRSIDMRSDLRHDRSTKRNIGNEVTVHLRTPKHYKTSARSSSHICICLLRVRCPRLLSPSCSSSDGLSDGPHTKSTWSQSQPWPMVLEHSCPSAAKSALRIEGAMIAGRLIVSR